MDTLQAIKNRISANFFDKTRKLSEEEIEEIVRYATEAPSSYNIQHWRFIAVTKQEDKERLKAAAYNQQKVADAAVTFIVLGDTRGYERLPEIYRPLVESGAMGAARVDELINAATNAYISNAQFARDEAIRSGALAAMTLMLAATAKGLASGPMIGFEPERVKREFQISDRYVPVMLVAVGYAAPGNFPRKPRLPVEEILAFNSGRKFSE